MGSDAPSQKAEEDAALLKPGTGLLSPFSRRKSSFSGLVMRLGGSRRLSSFDAADGGDSSYDASASPRLMNRASLRIDKNFVATAVILVPDALPEMRSDELEEFKASFVAGEWYDVEMAQLHLGCVLHIFPHDAILKMYKWVFWTDNLLNRKLFLLLVAMVEQQGWCEMTDEHFKKKRGAP